MVRCLDGRWEFWEEGDSRKAIVTSPVTPCPWNLPVAVLGGGKASEEPRIDYCVLWWVGCEVANKARAYFFASRSHVWSLSINASTRARHSLDHDRHKLTWNGECACQQPTKHHQAYASHVRLISRQVIVIQFVLGRQLAKVSGAHRRHYTRARAAATAPTPAG